jgi:hypothetical protein
MEIKKKINLNRRRKFKAFLHKKKAKTKVMKKKKILKNVNKKTII